VLSAHLERIRQGDMGDPQAHLRNKQIPQPQPLPFAKALDLWAAISGTLLVSIIIILLALRPSLWLLWLPLAILIFGMIEAGLQNRLSNYILKATVVLATIGAVVLFITYWSVVVVSVPLVIFFYSLLSNLAELRVQNRSSAKLR
jgi:hypothetical protein